jgi:hypothetical protein
MLLALHNVVAGFLRRTWLVALVTILVCASFAARAVAALSDAALDAGAASGAPGAGGITAEPPPPGGAEPPPPSPARAPLAASQRPPIVDAFVARNVFCSACAPPAAEPDRPSAYQGQPAVLIATSLGRAPRATVRVVPTEVQGSWGLGEDIPGVGRIDEIHATSIEVADAAGHTKLLSLVDATAAGPGATDAATSDARPAAGQRPFAGRIEQLGDGVYEVERSLVRELVMSASKPGMGGATPVVVNGEVQGIRLIGIGSRSPGHALDLRSGDLISSIDGVPLRNAQQVIDLFAKLDQVSEVALGGTRRGGKPLELRLKLR